MEQYSFRARLYKWLSRWHRLLGTLCICLILIAIVAAVLAWRYPHWLHKHLPSPLPELGTQKLAGLVSSVAAICSLAWLIWCSWFSISFRYLWFYLARSLGWLRRWLSSGWRKLLLLYALASALVCLYQEWILKTEEPSLAWFFKNRDGPWLHALLLACSIAFCRYLYHTRRRIVILSFVEHTGDTLTKDYVEGLTRRLQAALSDIRNVHRIVQDDPFSIEGTSEKATDPNYDVGETGESFKDIVSSENKVKLFGLVEFDFGKLIAAGAKLAGGPQITGLVQRIGNQLYLTASLRGANMAASWQVFESDLDLDYERRGESARMEEFSSTKTNRDVVELPAADPTGEKPAPSAILDRMVRQLAYRIFTEIEKNNLGSPHWKATVHYTSGLRQIRGPQGNQDVSLRRAEQHFVRALRVDGNFTQCYYNLGVVYQKLGRFRTAHAVFQKATELRRDWEDAFYALAKSAQGCGNAISALRHCAQVIILIPSNAKAWNLQGVLLPGHPDWKSDAESISPFSIATALAWRRLCLEALRRGQYTSSIKLAVQCATNLAICRGDRRSIPLLTQVVHLDPTNPETHFEAGRILLLLAKPKLAVKAFQRALHLRHAAKFWFGLAKAQDKITTASDPTESLERALDGTSFEAWEALQKTFQGHGHDPHWKKPKAKVLFDTIDTLRRKLKASEQSGGPGAGLDQEINERQEDLKQQSSNAFAYGIVAHRLGCLYLDKAQIGSDDRDRKQHVEAAANWFFNSIRCLRDRHTLEIASTGTYGSLASAYLEKAKLLEHAPAELQACLTQARHAAEEAVALSPTRAWERLILSKVHAALKDYERAQAELTIGLDLEPGDWGTMFELVNLMWNAARGITDRQKRRTAMQRIVRRLTELTEIVTLEFLPLHSWNKQPLEFSEYQNKVQGPTQGWMQRKGIACYLLGVFNGELGNLTLAQYYLEAAIASGYMPVEARVALCWLYSEAKAYDQAETAFLDLEKFIAELRQSTSDPLPPELRALGEINPLEKQLAQARLCTAIGLAERGNDLTTAFRRRLEAAQGREFHTKSPEEKNGFESLLCLSLGMIELARAQHLLSPSKKGPDRLWNSAIQKLKRAAAVSTNAEIHAKAFHWLGMAYDNKAELDAKNQAFWRIQAAKARENRDLADIRGQYVKTTTLPAESSGTTSEPPGSSSKKPE